jgi:hypothetical protein
MKGVLKVNTLGDPREPGHLPYAGLGLCAAGVRGFQPSSWDLSLTSTKVERALTLWSTGVLTVEAVETSRMTNRGLALRPSLNKTSGRMSNSVQAFNETNWGTATREYTQSAKAVSPERLKEIMELVCKYAGAQAMPGGHRHEPVDVNTNSARAKLVDLRDEDVSDDSMDGKFFFYHSFNVTNSRIRMNLTLRELCSAEKWTLYCI